MTTKIVDRLRVMAGTSRGLLGARLRNGRSTPFILSHLITGRCNADCPFCLFKGEGPELDTEDVKNLYRRAGEMGFLNLVVWGGEPLLREDLPEVLAAARRSGLRTTVITNGYFLPDVFREICPHLDMITVSLDAVGEAHDSIRRLPGAFQRAVEGIRQVRAEYRDVKVLINCVITRLNIRRIDSLLEFSRKNRLPVMFEPLTISDYGGHSEGIDVRALTPPREEGLRVAWRLISAKAQGFPVANSYEYLHVIGAGRFRYKCRYKRMVLRVEPDGRVMDCCLRRGRAVGDAAKGSLDNILRSPAYREFLEATENCSSCIDSATVESSLLWTLRPASLLNALKYF